MVGKQTNRQDAKNAKKKKQEIYDSFYHLTFHQFWNRAIVPNRKFVLFQKWDAILSFMKLKTVFNSFELLADAPNGVQKLRELILQLAVQGKLVPQEPTDEPASVLLEKIRVEKERLAKEKKNREIYPLPPVKENEILHNLPSSWAWFRLGEVVEYNAASKVSPNLIPEESWLLELEDIEKNSSKIIQRFTFKERKSKSTKAKFNKWDVLYGKLRPYLNKVVLADADGFCTTEIVPLRGYFGIIPKYLMYVLKRPDFLEYVNLKTYGVKMPRLGTDDGCRALLPLPPIEEQIRIVAKVDQLMALCDELEMRQQKRFEDCVRLNNAAITQLLATHEPNDFSKHWQSICNNFDLLYAVPENIGKLRQAILQLAVQGKLVPQDPNDEPVTVLLKRITAEKEWLIKEKKIKKIEILPPIELENIPFELVKGWKWARFCDVATIASNLVKPESYLALAHIAPDNIEKQTGKLLSYRTVGEDNVRSGNHRFFIGQILYSKIRPNLSKAIVVHFDGLCSADMYPINAYIDSKYLLKYILSLTFLSMAVKNDTRIAMPKINQDELNKILVPVPPLLEQKRIVAKVDQLMTLCNELEAKLIQSQNNSEKLMDAAVRQVLGV